MLKKMAIAINTNITYIPIRPNQDSYDTMYHLQHEDLYNN